LGHQDQYLEPNVKEMEARHGISLETWARLDIFDKEHNGS
jgi:hypothetical protein